VDHSADPLRPCLRPRTLHRRMDRGDGCSRLVPRTDRAAEAAPLQTVVRERCPVMAPIVHREDAGRRALLARPGPARRASATATRGPGRSAGTEQKPLEPDSVAFFGVIIGIDPPTDSTGSMRVFTPIQGRPPGWTISTGLTGFPRFSGVAIGGHRDLSLAHARSVSARP